VVENSRELRDAVEEAFAHKSRQWQEWRDNLEKVSRPDAALRVAELTLKEAGQGGGWPGPLRLFQSVPGPRQCESPGRSGAARVQLCDFHIHTFHSQGGLAVAAHPHVMKSEWGKNTLFLWENQEVFAPIIDAWEIANRNNIFTPVGLKRFAFLANSDFHKPKHIHSWKTLLQCEKDPEAIKDCIRRNEHVSLTLYRDGMSGEALRAKHRVEEAIPPEAIALRLALPAATACSS
jgi:hypothetical protein